MKHIKQIAAVISAAMLLSAVCPAVCAEELVNEDGKIYCIDDSGERMTGWHTVDGKKYYFKKDGTAAVKNTNINGVRYRFSSDGVCKGEYTGFSSKGGSRYYFENGVIYNKGWLTVNEKQYFFGSDGKMQTGTLWADSYEYDLGTDGVWNGESKFKPETVGKYLENTDYADDGIIAEFRVGFKEFKSMKSEDKKRLLELLSESSECELVYGDIDLDEMETPNIYYDDCELLTDIMVRFKSSSGTAMGGWYFQKDKKGNGYFCQYILNFGVVLESSEIYDMLKEAYSEQ